MHPEFEAVIGLEVHVQLATDSKIFSGSKARLKEAESVSSEGVNTNTDPICTGHPGTLPVLNRKVVEYAVRAGLATHCTIQPRSVFSRKHYFYPDLPKGYQISQFDKPICENGYLEIDTPDTGSRKITIQRIHIEEDAGKNVHMTGYSLVNLNRAGVPLIEIVSGPDMKSATEAGEYLRSLYGIVTYIGVCDGNLQEGNFRCDANVSVMKKGSKVFGTRAEIKNVNSFRFVELAIEYEIHRQIEVIQAGAKVIQETRGYDSAKGSTYSMRSKEEAQDYRYFPEPDLPPLVIDPQWVETVRASLPELPDQKKRRYVGEYGLTAYDAGVLIASKPLAEFFESTVALLSSKGKSPKATAKTASNLLSGEISRLLNDEKGGQKDISQSLIRPTHLSDLVELLVDQVISSTGAKQVITTIWGSGESVATVVEREGLKQVSDLSALEPVIEQVIRDNVKQAEEYRAGKDKLLGFFVGQVMKATGGKANPTLLQDLVKKKLQ